MLDLCCAFRIAKHDCLAFSLVTAPIDHSDTEGSSPVQVRPEVRQVADSARGNRALSSSLYADRIAAGTVEATAVMLQNRTAVGTHVPGQQLILRAPPFSL